MNLEELGVWELLQKKLTWMQLGMLEGKTILEFGCGNGVMGAYYAVKNTVIAIEPDAQILRENYYDNVKQICGNINELKSIEDSYFDIILCHNVFEYANDRQEIMTEFERVLKPNGMISILKHNALGRVMQMAVLLNNFDSANDLLDGKYGVASKYGAIRYYQDEELEEWAQGLKISKVLGIRTFWDLQQNQDIQTDKDWQTKMIELEQRVSDKEEFINIAFFHHVLLVKR